MLAVEQLVTCWLGFGRFVVLLLLLNEPIAFLLGLDLLSLCKPVVVCRGVGFAEGQLLLLILLLLLLLLFDEGVLVLLNPQVCM